MKEKRVVDVEELVVWTYGRQRADVVRWQGSAGPMLWAQDSLHRLEKIAVLGVRCDTSVASCQIHPDAEVVDDVVQSMRPAYAQLLVRYGKAGARPDWMPGVVAKMGPMLNYKGKPTMIYDQSGKHAIGCRVVSLVWSAAIEHARAEYAMWWDALCILADRLNQKPDQLASYRVARPSAPYLPWEYDAA